MANSKSVGTAFSDPQLTSGTVIGENSSAVIAFHGGTGSAQASFVATQSINAISVSGVVGFSSSAALSNALVLLNAIQAALVNKGLMASS